MGVDAPLCLDGFLAREEMLDLMEKGATGEICGWIFDGKGKLLDNSINERVASAPIPKRESCSVIGIAKGPRKYAAIRAALAGRQINGLITDEAAAAYLISR